MDIYTLLRPGRAFGCLEMKILVTGGNGYIGRRLVASLSRGHDVTLLDRSKAGSARTIVGDIRGELDLSGFDAVYHLAAVSSPSIVEMDRMAAWDVNVNGTLNIAKRLKAGQRLVFLSSAQVYGKKSRKQHTEADLPDPDNFYGLTKLVGEQLISFYARSAGFPFVIFRLFNAYSSDQPKGLIIGDLMDKYRSLDNIEVRNPRTALDMVHVDDAVNAIAGSLSFESGVYNLCSGHPITVREIYDRVREKAAPGPAKKEKVVSDKDDRLLGDNSKLKALGFGFREFTLE